MKKKKKKMNAAHHIVAHVELCLLAGQHTEVNHLTITLQHKIETKLS